MITEKELERLENLPKRIGFQKQAKLEDRGGWRRYRHGSNCYKIANRILKFNVGKSFDLAFSYFCKKVKKEEQYVFIRELNLNIYYGGYRNKYYLDENRLIQEHKYERTNHPYIWKSPDYKSERRYVSDDKLESEAHQIWGEQRKRVSAKDYVYVKVISGYTQEYAQNSAFAIKSKTEARKKYAKFERDNDIWDKKSKDADWVLRNKKQLAKEKEREEDRIRMEALGFDSNSFIGIEYHGQKRKLKNND